MATMNSVTIKANEIRAAANKLATLANTLQSSQRDLVNIKNRLDQIWEGPAADEFMLRFNDLTGEDLNEFVSAVNDYKNFLLTTATQTETTESTVKAKETSSLNDSGIEF